ncbi:FAD-binding oxidoreductase [Acidobacteriota bacterium]
MSYNRVEENMLTALQQICGAANVTSDPEKMLDYSHDEFSLKDIACMPEAVVKPTSTEEVSAVLKLANENKFPVTPRGGATGLCGGCNPSLGGIVLSLERMNRIIEIDKANQMAVVEAGVTLQDFYDGVESESLFLPPHPGEESAMLGGVIANNAGGARAVKYGVIRNYVRGLEVVLPSGKVINPGGKLMKTSTGYNLLNLFIGAEGTLGIVTKAIIQLMPLPRESRTLIIPYEDLNHAIETVPILLNQQIIPLAVEFVPRDVIRITEKFLNMQWPSSVGSTYLMIILDASSKEEMDGLSQIVGDVCMNNGALDVFVADSPQKQEQVLAIRSRIYEAIKAHTLEILDIVVPRAEIARHVKVVHEVSRRYDIWLPTFGHAADGNVHTHIMKARLEGEEIIPLPEEDWKPKFDKVRKDLYEDCRKRGGMISGEHGIGIVKKPYLSLVLSMEEIELMRGIKSLFDPNNILNPGKIFDLS